MTMDQRIVDGRYRLGDAPLGLEASEQHRDDADPGGPEHEQDDEVGHPGAGAVLPERVALG